MTRRIAIISRDVSGVTGTTTTIIEHTRRLRQRGWDPHIFGERIDTARIEEAGGQAHALARWRIGSYFKRRLFNWLLEKKLKSLAPFDLVHGHGDTLRQDVLSLHNCVHAAHQAVHGKPLAARAGVGRIHDAILRHGSFRRLIANSELMKRDLIARYAVAEDVIEVIYPGYDPRRFNAAGRAQGARIRGQMGLRPGEILIGLITSGDFTKRGVAPFLQALKRIGADTRAKLRVVILGQESRLGPYRALAAETGFGDRIHFLPPDPDIAPYYHALDVYVHPALYEEFGQSVQEAMACGVAVVTSERVGAAELLAKDKRMGVLAVPHAPALAELLARFVHSPALRMQAAEAGRQAVAANTWDENFRRTHALFEETLAARRA